MNHNGNYTLEITHLKVPLSAFHFKFNFCHIYQWVEIREAKEDLGGLVSHSGSAS
jgi:hypothetical protein